MQPIDTAAVFDETDPLTGLATWQAVQQRLVDAFARSAGGFVGVIRCGVDRFDWINDGLGLRGGDEALRRIAAILRAAFPPPAMVGRLGGDQFLIALPQMRDAQEVPASVRMLEARFRAPLRVGGHELFVSLSTGSAAAASGGATSSSGDAAERIMRDAGTALRRIADSRRGERMELSGLDLLHLDADLHHAVDRGEIVPYFQPQYDARSGTLTGYEALARWHHPAHGTLTPDRFIPLAEADGLIDRLGETVLEQACRFADLVAADRPLQMAVNVSVQQLSDPGLAGRIERVLEGYPDRAWTFTVEVTESALIRNQDLVLNELGHLRDLGVGVSIDDFGSGYSSLSQLRDLPATELKIDRSFVDREDATGTGLLAAIVALAGSLDLTVVAEGIETPTQLATLRNLGCDLLQGRYLCPPLPAGERLAAPSDITALLPPTRTAL